MSEPQTAPTSRSLSEPQTAPTSRSLSEPRRGESKGQTHHSMRARPLLTGLACWVGGYAATARRGIGADGRWLMSSSTTPMPAVMISAIGMDHTSPARPT